MRMGKSIFLIVFGFSGFAALVFVGKVFAEPLSQTIITWQANNFYPANYSGKPLATPATPISVSVEVAVDGKLIDLSRAEIIWYADNEVIGRGLGVKETTWSGKKTKGDDYFVRVSIKLDGRKFENSTRIPATKPLIVVESSNPYGFVRTNSQNSLQIIPYFFNVASLEELNFSWRINQKQVGGNDNQLIIKTSEPQTSNQSVVEVNASAQNRRNLLETASAKTKLTILK